MFTVRQIAVALLSASTILAAPLTSAIHERSGGVTELWLTADIRLHNETQIQDAGFNTIILFQGVIKPNGSLEYYGNDAPPPLNQLADGGVYVGGDAQKDVIQGYKAKGIRVELCMAQGQPNPGGSWLAVQQLYQTGGLTTDSPLAQNLVALRDAWGLDAINDDDEYLYDVDSTVAFANLLGQLGLKFTLAPYTEQSFWQQVVSGVNNADILDRSYLQCYDGGYGNDPSSWATAIGMPQIPLLWSTNTQIPDEGHTPSQMQSAMQAYQDAGGVVGGGIWDDQDIRSSGADFTGYSQALTNVFG